MKMKNKFLCTIVLTFSLLLAYFLYLRQGKSLQLQSAKEIVSNGTGYMVNKGDTSSLQVDFPSSRHESLQSTLRPAQERETKAEEQTKLKERETKAEEQTKLKERETKAEKQTKLKERETKAEKQTKLKERETKAEEQTKLKERETKADEQTKLKERETKAEEQTKLKERETKADEQTNLKERETIRLANIVQSRIRKRQNPANCSTAKKLVYQVDFQLPNYPFRRGLVSHIHMFTQALMYAYRMGRVLILLSKGFEYDPRGWEGMFLPLSETCTEAGGPRWKGNKYDQKAIDSQTMYLDAWAIGRLRIPLSPLSVPRDLAADLARVHGDPSAWWVGQFITYVMRPNQNLSETLTKRMSALQDFQHPIVGLQVRRGFDKSHPRGDHVAPTPLSLYMDHVQKYFSRLQTQGPVKKRMFIATDSPDVVKEAKTKHPDYIVVNDAASTASAADPLSRENVQNLVSTVLDLHFLAQSDLLVCTMSSNLCRAGYELMQARPGDWSDRLAPVDYLWVVFLYPRTWRAVEPETRPGWLPLKVGDQLLLDRALVKDGEVKGKNLRLNAAGRIAFHKIAHDDPPFDDTKA